MTRAIVRYSIDGSSETANRARAALEVNSAFHKVGTGAYEARGPDESEIISRLGHLLEVLKERPGGGRLDHLWIYLDTPLDTGSDT